MDKFAAILKAIGVGRIIGLVMGLILVAALSAFLIKRVSAPTLTLLYGSLNSGEAADIATKLDGMGIPYEVRGAGTVYVPKDRVGELRLQMAGSGVIGSASAGYEIFDKQSSFGTTSLVQNLNAKRALEGELSRTIATMPAVQTARVHLVTPKKRTFNRQTVKSTAAVAINVGSRLLTDEQINSITHLVAAAVPGLGAKDVTVVDQRGNLLTAGKGQDGGAVTFQERVRGQIEKNYETNVTSMIERVVGVGRVAVKVNADMDFNRIEELAETYDPNGQVARSEQASEDVLSSNQSNGTPAVGLTGATPGNATGTSVGAQEEQTRSEQTTNYEISKNVKRIMNEGGAIERLSVAVLVESTAGADPAADGYTPLDDQTLRKLKTLVERAIGFDEERGDKVEIIDLPFTAVPEPEGLEEAPMFSKADYMRFAELGGMIVLAILILLLVVSPMIKTVETAFTSLSALPPSAAPPPGAAAAGAGAAGVAAVAPGAAPIPAPGAAPGPGAAAAPEEPLIDMGEIEGRVKDSTLKKVHEIVGQYPEESVQVVRNWIADGKSSGGSEE